MKLAVAGGTGTVGRHVVDVAHARGHEVVVLARSTGVDLVNGDGLADRLDGVNVVIDVTSVATQSGTVSTRFFAAVAANLLAAESLAGVSHHIALSIVGSDRAPFGYYAGKSEQERLVVAGASAFTILRATQFHEFARQIYGQVRIGPITLVPKMISQPVAAREVGERLVEIAENEPLGHSTDLGGPEKLRMVEMVRAYAAAIGETTPIVEVPLPGGFGRALRNGTLIPAAGADHGKQTFAEWIAQLARREPS